MCLDWAAVRDAYARHAFRKVGRVFLQCDSSSAYVISVLIVRSFVRVKGAI